MIPSLSPAEKAHSAAFNLRLKSNGNRVHFRNEFLRAIVDYDTASKVIRRPDFDQRTMTVIEVRVDNFQTNEWDNRSDPRPGEHFVTDDGFEHRVLVVKRMGFFIRCWCQTGLTCGNYLRNESGEFLQAEDGSLLKTARCASSARP